LSRLVVVSNRVVPLRRKATGSEGGLAVAVSAAMRERGGLWFGWSGKVQDTEAGATSMVESGNVTYGMVDLSTRDHEGYYNGYANRALWPLFHHRLDLTEFSRRNFHSYERVNDLFADRLLPLLRPDDLIWVHDYHLIPFGEQLRQRGCRQRIGFFLHIPWPSLEIFLALPNHREIARALCAYDVVGFQTLKDLRAFHSYIEEEAQGTVHRDGTIECYGRRMWAGAFPIGIDTDNVAQAAAAARDSPQTRRLVDSLRGRRLIIGVDRLDYSKGLLARMGAIEHLLRNYPANRGNIIMLQITPPSRTDVPEYVAMRRQLGATVGRINGAFADFDWNPIRYLNKGFRRQTLAGFFRVSRIGLVTPLRDGMNLVAKEYVAAQDPDDPGVLVLSRFAGAAQALEGALIVNPYDEEGTAAALEQALTMPLDERRVRWRRNFDEVSRHDVTDWQKRFVGRLTAA
jgi:trehalose 6-phosphate synthase